MEFRHSHDVGSEISSSTPWPLAICMLLFALTNFTAMPLGEVIFANNTLAQVAISGYIAVIVTQLAFLAVWCVLAPFSLGHRLVSGVLLATGLLGAWFFGFLLWAEMIGLPFREWDELGTIFLSIPLLAVAVQTPLWAAKFWFGWRIVTPAHHLDDATPRPFGIRDLLIGMALGACVLSAAQLAVPPNNMSTENFLVPLAIAAVVLAVVSLLTTVPAIATILRSRRIAPAVGVLLLYGFALAVGVIETFVAFAQTDTLMLRLGFGNLLGVCFLSLTGCMLAFRAAGWRLQWGKPRKTTPEPPAADPLTAEVV